MLAPVITRFLTRWYKGRRPTCLQTLTYKFSSEQGAHSDKKLVDPPQAYDYDRETLVASWFALEPSSLKNGALIIYPG
jgi:ectoine hydroxylase-related dioxygenase (phytanoyl-CoA dioxygenase family)